MGRVDIFLMKTGWLRAAALAFLCLFLAQSASAAWHDNNWLYRREITILSSEVSATLTDFPVLIKINADAQLAAAARSNGFDILFTDDDGTTKLDHEIEEYVTGTGDLVAWVKVPTLLATADKTLYLYYGYASSANQANPTGVWTEGFGGVWHWDDDFLDSAGSNHGINQGSSDTAAMFAKGQSFDGIDDYVDLTVMNPRSYDDFTISVWYKSADMTVSEDEYIYMHFGTAIEEELVFGPTDDQGDALRLGITWDSSWEPYYSTTDIVDQQWHHLVGVRGGGRIKLWVDGMKEVDVADPNSGQTHTLDVRGPYAGDDPGVTEQVHGTMDELRLASAARSDGWVQTEFNNQNDPGSFFTIGSQEAAGYTVSGTVFEDADFAGTAANYDGGAGDLGLVNVDVELYDNSDTYLASTTTAVDGSYSFAALADGGYKVRVRSTTIGDADTPPAGGLHPTVPGTWPYPLAEMSWGNGAAMIGGRNSEVDDTATGDNGGIGDTWVAVTVSGSDVTDVDIGFTYLLVVNTLDDGLAGTARSDQGSLRQFLKNSNAITGPETSYFSISAPRVAGAHSIQPITALPTVDDPAVLDGTTEPDFLTTPVIELDGTLAPGGSPGLRLAAGNTTVRGLAINRFSIDGIMIIGGGGNLIVGNHIGTDVTGLIDRGNSGDGIDIQSDGNIIGGDDAVERNVIAGNQDGIDIDGVTGNVVTGNFVGTDATGAAPMGNHGHGVLIKGTATNTRVGGTAPGEGNVIAANDIDGIRIEGDGSNTIEGNLVGVDVSGTGDLGNTSNGIYIVGSPDNIIGGTSASARNIVSGNDNNGILLASTAATNNSIQGNYVGLNAAGTAAIPNADEGVDLSDSPGNTIGGTAAGAGNIISGNGGAGVLFFGSLSTGNNVLGNRIGTNASGLAAAPNTGAGVEIRSASNTVGGASAGAGNVISGNGDVGVLITGADATGVVITGNIIGLTHAGDAALGNANAGIRLTATSDNLIGGVQDGSGNIIAYNGNFGVNLQAGTMDISILGNSMFDAGGLGIDLGEDGITENDALDIDPGVNDLLNFPVITSAEPNGANLDIEFDLDVPGGDYRIEFFTNPGGPDPSGNGEGEAYADAVTITHSGTGVQSFAHSFTGAGGDVLTSTATEENAPGDYGNTSEFSDAFTASATAQHDISGIVFEDVDFAGTATNWDGGAGDVALANVDVELYDAADAYLASASTAGDGSFSFTGLTDGNYKVRIRSATIGDADTPPAGGLHPTVPAAWPYPLAEITWGHGGALVGGQDPTIDDTNTPDNASPGDTWASITISGADVTGVNFGSSFDLIVNEDDDANADNLRSKQGSLRQFIKNSNAIVGVNKSWFQISGN